MADGSWRSWIAPSSHELRQPLSNCLRRRVSVQRRIAEALGRKEPLPRERIRSPSRSVSPSRNCPGIDDAHDVPGKATSIVSRSWAKTAAGPA